MKKRIIIPLFIISAIIIVGLRKDYIIGQLGITANGVAGCPDSTRQEAVCEDSISVLPELSLICQDDSFANFLRALPRKDRSVVVKDFDGNEAGMEDYKYCVIDFPLLSEIEQCADVCMHLRTEFLFRQRNYNKIHFHDIDGNDHPYEGGASRTAMERYLCRIYAMSNTYSMFKEMETVPSFEDMKPGDVFINPADGYILGHAIIVMDVARDADGNVYFQAAQGYTPACDFHLIDNTIEPQLSPWFKLKPGAQTVTIGSYDFEQNHLKRWKD